MYPYVESNPCGPARTHKRTIDAAALASQSADPNVRN